MYVNLTKFFLWLSLLYLISPFNAPLHILHILHSLFILIYVLRILVDLQQWSSSLCSVRTRARSSFPAPWIKHSRLYLPCTEEMTTIQPVQIPPQRPLPAVLTHSLPSLYSSYVTVLYSYRIYTLTVYILLVYIYFYSLYILTIYILLLYINTLTGYILLLYIYSCCIYTLTAYTLLLYIYPYCKIIYSYFI